MDAVSSADSTDHRPLGARVARGGLSVLAGSYFQLLFGFAASLLLTRLLTPDAFGTFALASFFVSVLNLRSRFLVGLALGQRRVLTPEFIATHLIVDVVAGLGSLLLALLAAPILRLAGYSQEAVLLMLVLAGSTPIAAMMGTPWILLERELHFGRTSLVSSVTFAVSYVPGVWLAWHGGGAWSLVAQNLTYTMLVGLAMWAMLYRTAPESLRGRWRFRRSLARELLRFGGLAGLGSLASTVANEFDNFLVGTFVGVTTLGYYDRAYRIAMWPTLLVTAVLSRVGFYTYARLQDDTRRLQIAVQMTVWLITNLAVPLAIGLFIAAPDLLRLFYGEAWLPATVFLQFLVVYAVLRPLLDDASALFTALGKLQWNLLISVIRAGGLVAIGLPLTLGFGAIGTSVAVGVSIVLAIAVTYAYVRRVVNFSVGRSILIPLAIAVISLGVTYGLSRLVQSESVHLVMRITIILLAACATFWLGSLLVNRQSARQHLALLARSLVR